MEEAEKAEKAKAAEAAGKGKAKKKKKGKAAGGAAAGGKARPGGDEGEAGSDEEGGAGEEEAEAEAKAKEDDLSTVVLRSSQVGGGAGGLVCAWGGVACWGWGCGVLLCMEILLRVGLWVLQVLYCCCRCLRHCVQVAFKHGLQPAPMTALTPWRLPYPTPAGRLRDHQHTREADHRL